MISTCKPVAANLFHRNQQDIFLQFELIFS
jgi:hypothetical protein